MKRLATLVASGLIAGLPAVASARPIFFFGFRFPWFIPAPVVVPPPVVVAPAPLLAPAPVVVTYAPAPVYTYVYTYPGPRYIYYYHYGPVGPYRYWR